MEGRIESGLKDPPSLEVKRRLERMLSMLRTGGSASLKQERLRTLRLLQILEQIGDQPATKVLDDLARGAAEPELQREAELALNGPAVPYIVYFADPIQGLARGWPKDRRPRLSPRVESDLDQVAMRLSPEKRSTLVRLAALWGSKKFQKYAAEITRSLLDHLHDDSLSVPERINAARELVSYRLGDEQVIQSLLDMITPRTSPVPKVSGFFSVRCAYP